MICLVEGVDVPYRNFSEMERSYAVVLEPESEGGFSVHIPAFRGAHTQGETPEECLRNAREVLELHADVYDRAR